MKVPYLFMQQQNAELRKELLTAVDTVLEKSMFILGDETKKFEKAVAAIVGTKHAISVNSGTDALLLPLVAVGVKANDEVITVSNSFVATANAITLLGAVPVFVDVGDTMLMDVSLLEQAITPRTKAIIVVHLTGKPAHIDAVMTIAHKHKLVVIEDCAQAIGAMYKGKQVGSFGIGAFSFHPLKNISACGDAGIITTNDDTVHERLLLLRNHGLVDRDTVLIAGYNSRLDEIQASILNVKLTQIDWITTRRRENAALYYKLFSQAACKDVLYVPHDLPDEFSVYHTFVVRVNKRDALQAYLAEQGIETKIHYAIPIHRQKPYTCLSGNLPKTNEFASQILSLPIQQYLSPEQIRYVVDTIVAFYRKDLSNDA